MSTLSKPDMKIVFGAMTLGRKGEEQARVHQLDDCAAILDIFQKFGHEEVDTARGYSKGSSEEYLGQLRWQDRGLVMDTKLAPYGRFSHKPDEMKSFVMESLDALQTKKVDIWYLHAPDHSVPYEDTLREVNNLYEQGYFRRFGISKYAAWEVAQICEICIRNNWKKPDVYQGAYCAVQRAVEPELFPCLRYYDIAFYAYNPLAGGFLTDRYERSTHEHEEGSRFDPGMTFGGLYRAMYWNDVYFDALDVIRPAAGKLGMTTAEAALRWLHHHSLMKPEQGDAIIIGASSAKQLEENLTNLAKGPLPDEMLEAFNRAWDIVKPVCMPYYIAKGPLPDVMLKAFNRLSENVKPVAKP
ncbi:NADP-dependent oxidoreductase domain-containing protein [Hypoxylon cercidicola]|nr:NADP-dependent oxidoreductase domain-containing protein [Hypoxylon cercidicola]